jgi:hypothetical protein
MQSGALGISWAISCVTARTSVYAVQAMIPGAVPFDG